MNKIFQRSDQFRQEFHLPEPNVFIAENTDLVPETTVQAGKEPVQLVCDEQGELWYKVDRTFLQPRAYIHYLLRSPLQLESVEKSCLLDLLAACLSQNIVEDVYPADLAQLHYSVYAVEQGLVLKVRRGDEFCL